LLFWPHLLSCVFFLLLFSSPAAPRPASRPPST
jgi:hypothetical protein